MYLKVSKLFIFQSLQSKFKSWKLPHFFKAFELSLNGWGFHNVLKPKYFELYFKVLSFIVLQFKYCQ